MLSAALSGSACSEGFLPASLITNTRVLAVVAEPPEAVPGQQVTLTPLVVSPAGELVAGEGFGGSWWRCPDEDRDALGDFSQCSVPAQRREVGSGVPHVDTVPQDIFGDLSAFAPGAPPVADPMAALPGDKLLGMLLGYWRVVGLTVTAPLLVIPGDEARRVDAFKRVPVRLPVAISDVSPELVGVDTLVAPDGTRRGQNINPTLSAVLVHEDSPRGPTVTKVSPGGTYFLDPVYDADTLEDYISLRVDLTGLDVTDAEALRAEPTEDLLARFEKVQRCEVPVFSWFVTHGRVRRETSLDESVVTSVFAARDIDCPPVEGEERAPEVEYTAPSGEEDDPLPEDGIVRGWVVMRDGRGGTATRAFNVTVE